MPHPSAGERPTFVGDHVEIVLFFAIMSLDVLDCYDGIEGVHVILLPLLKRKLEFQNTISDTERYQQTGYISVACR